MKDACGNLKTLEHPGAGAYSPFIYLVSEYTSEANMFGRKVLRKKITRHNSSTSTVQEDIFREPF